MRDRQPIRTQVRKVRHREREEMGLVVPPCDLCIHEHHAAGRQHDVRLKARVCEFHHRKMHEQMLCAGISLTFQSNPIKRVAMALRSAAVYERESADAKERWADLLDDPKGKRS